jgi:acetate---CoA ligase (ADP-forming)
VARTVASAEAAGDGEWLSEQHAKELLSGAGVTVVEGRVVSDEDDAVRALAELGGHIALKLSAPRIQHKSDVGAIELGLRSEAEVRSAFARLAALPLALSGDAAASVLAERMAAPGLELIVAARADAIVPALVVGLGGVWTEMLGDVAIVPLPASAARIETAVRSLRGAPLLTGARGSAPVAVAAAARLAERVGEILIEESLDLIELNPVFVSPDGAVAIDAIARRIARRRVPVAAPLPDAPPPPAVAVP